MHEKDFAHAFTSGVTKREAECSVAMGVWHSFAHLCDDLNFRAKIVASLGLLFSRDVFQGIWAKLTG